MTFRSFAEWPTKKRKPVPVWPFSLARKFPPAWSCWLSWTMAWIMAPGVKNSTLTERTCGKSASSWPESLLGHLCCSLRRRAKTPTYAEAMPFSTVLHLSRFTYRATKEEPSTPMARLGSGCVELRFWPPLTLTVLRRLKYVRSLSFQQTNTRDSFRPLVARAKVRPPFSWILAVKWWASGTRPSPPTEGPGNSKVLRLWIWQRSSRSGFAPWAGLMERWLWTSPAEI